MGHPLTPFCSAGSYAECDLWGRIQGFACNLKFERDKNFFNGGYAVLDRTLAAVCAVPADGAGTEKIKGVCPSDTQCTPPPRTRQGKPLKNFLSGEAITSQ